MSKRTTETAAELTARLNADPAYLARKRAQEDIRLRQAIADAEAEAPVVEALRKCGLDVDSVWRLVNMPNTYDHAIHVLADQLQRPYPDRVLEGVARAMAIPAAREVWNEMISVFRAWNDPTAFGAKAGLANAIAAAADDSVIEDVIQLIQERQHGDNRALLLTALGRSRDPNAHRALEESMVEGSLRHEAERQLRRVRKRTPKTPVPPKGQRRRLIS
jgi:hypothetical protein